MKRITWLALSAGVALAGCGGVAVIPGGPSGTGGSAGTSGTGGSAGTSGSGGSGGSACCVGETCCSSDSDCPPDTECAFSQCMPARVPGCWRDADCGPNQRCVGASPTPCGTRIESRPGTCESASCCSSDADCGAGEECVSGECKAKPAPGQCWRDSDCLYGNCTNASVCPCGVDTMCPATDTVGHCPPLNG